MKVLVVMGTRPEAIKMAPVVSALQAYPHLETVVCLTGQHKDLVDQALSVFNLPIAYSLDVMQENQTLEDVTGTVLHRFGNVLKAESPNLVLVHGDTTTTFASALAAYYHGIPIGHVEAGLRTYHKYQPFPEEMNRRLTDHLADLHYAPTATARENLIREGIRPNSILVTGNTVIDAVQYIAQQPYIFPRPGLGDVLQHQKVILVTAHRRESFGAPLQQICQAVAELVHRHPELAVVYPVHPNPNVQRIVFHELANTPRVHLLPPMEYLPFVHLMMRAWLILTDSGGIQEEAPALGKPVLVLREVTERPEAVAAGVARLVGTRREKIVEEVERLLQDSRAYEEMITRQNPFGDGKAAERIAAHIAQIGKGQK